MDDSLKVIISLLSARIFKSVHP